MVYDSWMESYSFILEAANSTSSCLSFSNASVTLLSLVLVLLPFLSYFGGGKGLFCNDQSRRPLQMVIHPLLICVVASHTQKLLISSILKYLW